MASWSVYSGVMALASYAVFLLGKLYINYTRGSDKQLKLREPLISEEKIELTDAFKITPLPDFDWQNTEPLKFRNFKTKFHMTMGISNCPLSELIEMDKNYLSRIQLRNEIMRGDHHDMVIRASPVIKPAIDELYTWLTNTYLPTRFPTMFTLGEKHLRNLVTSESLPLQPPSDPINTFELLGGNLDNEFMLLLPTKEGEYELQGFVACFPSGFDTNEKFGMKLRDIHGPVPGYKEKLEKSMDRFFEKLEVGRVVRRSNWSITTHDRLFAANNDGLHEGAREKPPVAGEIDMNNASLRPSKMSLTGPCANTQQTFLRCERQCLHRLPKTRAIVFSFKTYLYPISDIKNEGSGEDFIEAIEGLKVGSVPEMQNYKSVGVWGDAVKAYLRS